MTVGETYRIYATYSPPQFADVEIVELTDKMVTFKRLKDGELVEVERDWIEKKYKQLLGG